MPQTPEQLYATEADKLPTKPPEVTTPKWSPNQFFEQRHSHRKWLFWFSLGASTFSLLVLFAIIGFQTWLRIHINPKFEIVSDLGLQIIAVAVFGEVFGVVYVIAHALWSNHEFNLMLKDGEK